MRRHKHRSGLTGFLAEAFADAQRRVEIWREQDLLGSIRRLAIPRTNRDVAAALRRQGSIRVMAEFKRSSPSAGVLRPSADVAERVHAYVAGGAAAVSVLTESHWFRGSLDDLIAARRAAHVPLLRKDFLVDEYDLEVSAACGADAVLLIAAALDPARLREMLAYCRRLGLSALVETHDRQDVKSACDAGAQIIGVNSRDLRTLNVDVAGAMHALREIPTDRIKVFESGVRSPADVRAAWDAGADAVLVGEALMRAAHPAQRIRELIAVSTEQWAASTTEKAG